MTPWLIRHPLSVMLLAAIVVLSGFFALGRLPLELLPRVTAPPTRVQISVPGVPAAVIEETVTRRLEETLALTDGLAAMESVTRQGSAVIELHWVDRQDADAARREVAERMERARPLLPAAIETPVVVKFDRSAETTEFVVVFAAGDLLALRDWAESVLAKQFLSLPGVSAVEVVGGVTREILVQPDQRQLAGLGLSFHDLIQAIKKGNDPASVGDGLRALARKPGRRQTARLGNVAALAALPVPLPNGESILLAEVASIDVGEEAPSDRIRFNGVDGVKILVQKQSQVGAEAIDRVRAHVDWMRANRLIPAGVEIRAVSDRSPYVRQSLKHVGLALIGGMLLAMLTAGLALGWRRALVIGAVLLVSLQAALTLLATAGLTLNIMTLGGLILGMSLSGMYSILVLENGARQRVVSTIIVGAAIMLTVLLPTMLIGGEMARLFRELLVAFGMTLVVALLTALILAPVLTARVRRIRRGRWRRVMARTRRAYGCGIGKILDHPIEVTAAVVLLVIVAAFAVRAGREELPPTMDDGRVEIRLLPELGPASGTLDERVQRIEKSIRAQADVASVFTQLQRHATDAANGFIIVQLTPRTARRVTRREWIEKFQAAAAQQDLDIRPAQTLGTPAFLHRQDLRLRLQGPDPVQLVAMGDELVQRLKSVPGLRALKHSAQIVNQELAVHMNPERARELDVDVAEAGRALGIATSGIVVGDFHDGDRRYGIRLHLPSEAADGLALDRILLLGELPDRPAVYLSDVASVQRVTASAEIRRRQRIPTVEISAEFSSEAAGSEAMTQVRRRLQDYPLPVDYLLVDNDAEHLGRGPTQLAQNSPLSLAGEGQGRGRVMLLAWALVFAALGMRYRSWRPASLVILSTPTVLAGFAGIFAAFNLPLSWPVWLGTMVSTGIVGAYAVVFVDYTRMRRTPECPARATIVHAAKRRLRPLLAITLTAAAGMLPLALGVGEGMELLQPLAATLIAGLLFSLMTALWWVPLLYRLLGLNAEGLKCRETLAKG